MQLRKPWAREGERLARRSHSEAAADLGPEPSRAVPLSMPVALEPPEQKNIPLGHRPHCQSFQRSATRRVPAPVASPQSSGMAGGPGPPSQAYSRGRRHLLPQSACLGLRCHPRNSPALRPAAQIGLQPPCPDGAPGRVGGTSPPALPPALPPPAPPSQVQR